MAEAAANTNPGKNKSIADAQGNRYCTPFIIDLLTVHYLLYPSGLLDPLMHKDCKKCF